MPEKKASQVTTYKTYSPSVGGNGLNVVVAWMTQSPVTQNWFTVSNDGGNTFSTPQLVSPLQGIYPNVIVSPPHLHFIWSSNNIVHYVFSPDMGTSLTAHNVTVSTSATGQPSFVLVGTALYVTYANGQIMFTTNPTADGTGPLVSSSSTGSVSASSTAGSPTSSSTGAAMSSSGEPGSTGTFGSTGSAISTAPAMSPRFGLLAFVAASLFSLLL